MNALIDKSHRKDCKCLDCSPPVGTERCQCGHVKHEHAVNGLCLGSPTDTEWCGCTVFVDVKSVH